MQVALRSAQGSDYVEVGCRLPKNGPTSGRIYSLYRNSVVSDSMRIYVATFDADVSEAYNRENCQIARKLFESQPNSRTTWWCERVPPR